MTEFIKAALLRVVAEMGDKTQLLAMAVGNYLSSLIPMNIIKFMFFGTLTIYSSVPSVLLSPMYIILYFLVLGILIYVFGVKLSYQDQACNIVLPNKEIVKDNIE